MAHDFDGTLVLTLRLELFDEEERAMVAQNLEALVRERVERWPDAVADLRLEEEYFPKRPKG